MENISFKYDKSTDWVLKNISINIKPGQAIALAGESGAGKSELSHSLALLLKKQGQRVKILHTDNYYKIPPNLRSDWRKKNGVKKVGFKEYDWKLLNRNIKEFKGRRDSNLYICAFWNTGRIRG